MNLQIGIVGLPNIGKSTLFNALLKKQQAFVANYPFATLEPNVGVVPVPDARLLELAKVIAFSEHSENSAKSDNQNFRQSGISDSLSHSEFSEKLPPIKPATVEFVDIAGLVKGASEGAGLGNKFLSHIREVSVIAHVVRAFADENIIREGSIDFKTDYQTIQTELMLADLGTIQNSKLKTQKSKLQLTPQNLLDRILSGLDSGIPVRDIELTDDEKEEIRDLHLLTAKPEIIVLNVSEEEYTAVSMIELIDKYSRLLLLPKDRFVVISAKIESDLASLSEEEQKDYLKELRLDESGLERLIKTAYQRLGLVSFLTAGEKEIRAWTIKKGTGAGEAAGVIHTDFSKNFIKAEVVSYGDFVQNKGWKGSREKGKTRLEGRDYIMQEADIVEFKIGT
ncbi:redox-regulated ATPase YchF [Patescibacteria group bacterium]|nr:redox-regulated ATPase YchF [Patescibacteria group bacterium]MCL5010081.1 redox-regulated ATPase YchF [Patescibacteria group bacterium]